MNSKTFYIYLFLVLLLCSFGTTQAQQKVIIVAAANLKVALDSVAAIFKKEYPIDATIIYGSSGKLFQQIANGAPYDLFFSADMEFPTALKNKQLTSSAVKIYAVGKLAIWSKKLDPNTLKINSLLSSNITKIAIANTTNAPYGAKALEALNYYKVYNKIKSKLVIGENIAQTAQFVSSGAADIGIIALSLALTPNMQKEGGKFYIIPEKSHQPLEQGCVILKQGKENKSASLFYNYISSKKAVAILKYYGYSTK